MTTASYSGDDPLRLLVDPPPEMAKVLADVIRERYAQDAKWGEQNHPNGTGSTGSGHHWGILADSAREECQIAAERGSVTWVYILREEIYEAFAEDDPVKLRAELIQATAVLVAWVEAIDRRSA